MLESKVRLNPDDKVLLKEYLMLMKKQYWIYSFLDNGKTGLQKWFKQSKFLLLLPYISIMTPRGSDLFS